MLQFTCPKINPDLLFSEEEIIRMQSLALSKQEDFFFDKGLSQSMLQQLKSRAKVKDKLSYLFQEPKIVYPPSLNLEQSSSEVTAKFKASLFSGKCFIDLCCGFGIDSFFLAQNFSKGILVEKDKNLANITSHNFALLNQQHIQFAIGMDAANFSQQFHEKVDLIYIDPSRRNSSGNKVVSLTDCEPNVIDLFPNLLNISNTLLIKTSPLLDIQHTCNMLTQVKNVYIVSVENECKELLFEVEKNFNGKTLMHAIQLPSEEMNTFSFTMQEEKEIQLSFSLPQKFLYEPNAAIMKSGAFKSVAKKFGLHKLHQHTHLYTSHYLLTHFPGRSFEILSTCKVDKQSIHKLLPEGKANFSLRNFPGKTSDLQKKLNIKDGGENYVFATTNCENKKQLIVTIKAK